MASSIPARVEPSVLRWARRSVGLTPLAAARKIGVPDDRVDRWESGDAVPTVAQLRRAASVYRRTLAVFFLAEPPAGFDTMRDFRRVGTAEQGEWSVGLHDEYRRAHRQREHLVELSELDDVEMPTLWGVEGTAADVEDRAVGLRRMLVEVAPDVLPPLTTDPRAHLTAWTAAVEASGVMVMTTSGGRVEVSEARAFSLYFDVAPVIALNGADSARGRLFSLLHELAHLSLRSAGLCDTTTDTRSLDADRALEAECNAVAAATLMPAGMVLDSPAVVARASSPSAWDDEALKATAGPFGVSAEALLRRLVTLGRVDRSAYDARRPEFQQAYEAEAARRTSGGGNWYLNTVRNLGKGYVRRVVHAYERRIIDSYTAATYLDVKVDQLPRLARSAASQEPASSRVPA